MANLEYYFTQIPTYEKDNFIQHFADCFLLRGNESNSNVSCESKRKDFVSKYQCAYFFMPGGEKTTIDHR